MGKNHIEWEALPTLKMAAIVNNNIDRINNPIDNDNQCSVIGNHIKEFGWEWDHKRTKLEYRLISWGSRLGYVLIWPNQLNMPFQNRND